jgi:integrase
LRTFLLRQTPWKALQEEVAAAGGELVPYAFRHRYAKASHAAGLPVASTAAAMGHTVAVHLAAYARFQPDAVAAAHEQVNRVPAVAL